MQTNRSTTIGTTGWFQGNDAVFPAQGGATTSYIGANFNNTTGTNTISNWLLTPPIGLQNGAVLTFWTRTVDAPGFAEIRERVCLGAAWLGVVLDEQANQAGGPRISTAGSRVSAWAIPTNEELMIARHTRRVLAAG